MTEQSEHQYAEAPYLAIFQAPGDSAPRLEVRATTEQQLSSKLQALENNSTFADFGRLHVRFQSQFAMGKELDAKSMDAPQNADAEAPSAPETQEQSQPVSTPPQAASQQAQVQQAHQPPPQPPQPQMQQAQQPVVQQQRPQPQQMQAPQGHQPPVMPQGHQPPQMPQGHQPPQQAPPQQSGQTGPGMNVPGAPFVNGSPARLVTGSSSKGEWTAWADPRPQHVTQDLEKTDDVDHPGLAAGTHKLWKFLR